MTINNNGATPSTIEENILKNTDLFRSRFGDVDVSETSINGELISIVSEIDTRSQQDLADSWTQNNIDSATGLYLDKLALLKNVNRKVNEKSVVFVDFAGTNTTVIPANTELKSGNFSYFTDYEIVIGGGVGSCSATSELSEAVADINTIQLATPITGISSVLNISRSYDGYLLESDTSLRNRVKSRMTTETYGLEESLIWQLENTINVKKVSILANRTNATIENVPAKHFNVVVLGGNRAEIGQVIQKHLGLGSPSYGDIIQKVKGQLSGKIYDVYFSNPTQTEITVSATITTDETFNPSSGYKIIQTNIINHFNDLKIGQDLIYQKLESLCVIDGVTSVNLLVDSGTSNVTASFDELFITSTDLVEVL